MRALQALLLSTVLAGCGGDAAGDLVAVRAPADPAAAVVPAPRPPLAGVDSVVPAASTDSCAARALGSMSDEQLAAQVFMIGVPSAPGGGRTATLAAVAAGRAANVVLSGTGWRGLTAVRSAASAVQAAAAAASGGPRALIAGNQEGGAPGAFQAFYGPGFSAIPSALAQGATPPAQLQQRAASWGAELAAAGVNLDLGPVMDVPTAAEAAGNGPIGVYGREYGYDGATVTAHADAFIRGLRAAGVAAVVKHFPGLGHVRGNTDVTTAGITDTVTTASGPDPAIFASGIAAGARIVMVSLATYARIDPSSPAAFSSPVLQGVLRRGLGFDGVILSDDLAGAAAVRSVPAGDRAVRFLAAGGDMVLAVGASTAGTMLAQVLRTMRRDAAFRARVAESAGRILRLKRELGLLGC